MKRLKLKLSVQFEQLQEQAEQLEETQAVASGSRLKEKLEVMKDDMESKIFEAQEELKHAKQESAKVQQTRFRMK